MSPPDMSPPDMSPPDMSPPPGALAPYRILDLTTERSWLTGKLLADLGATVVKVEPPGGDPGRWRGPYADDVASPDHSVTWWAYNRGKRSVTVRVDSADGRELFLRLVAQADAVLESFTPGRFEEWGLGYEELAAVNGRLVLTRISPFGQTGPYARLAANDLILAAIGGPAWMAGDRDRAPVRLTVPQYFLHAAAEAAVHTSVALYHASVTGQGQQVDVSAQLATMRTTMNALAGPHTDGSVLSRTTFGEPTAAAPYRSIFRCADGHILAAVAFHPGLKGYLAWMRAEGVALPAFLDELDDEQLGPQLLAQQPPDFADRVSDVLGEFFAHRFKEELTEQALTYRVMLVPINNMGDVRSDVQLSARQYFQPVDHEGRGAVFYPHSWAHLSRTPLVDTPRAPHIGEDNATVWLDQVGLSPGELTFYQQAGTI